MVFRSSSPESRAAPLDPQSLSAPLLPDSEESPALDSFPVGLFANKSRRHPKSPDILSLKFLGTFPSSLRPKIRTGNQGTLHFVREEPTPDGLAGRYFTYE